MYNIRLLYFPIKKLQVDEEVEQFYSTEDEVGYIGWERSIDSGDYRCVDTTDGSFNPEKYFHTPGKDTADDVSDDEWQVGEFSSELVNPSVNCWLDEP